ncbi:MAG: hypothetical protein ACLFR0_09195, partial [Alphaproteobacteria bacterium]
NLYREVSNASFYSPPLEYFRRSVSRVNKNGERKNYNGIWIETDRGAYTLVKMGALAKENKEFTRENVFALVFSDNPDFLAKAFYGTKEEQGAISREDFEKHCEVIETRLEHEIERGHKTDLSGHTYYEMGWALSAIELDALDEKTGKKNFFRYKGSSLPSGDTIQRSGSIISWREPHKKHKGQYNNYIYANPEFGKEHMRLTEWDMQSGLVRKMMRLLSIRVNDSRTPFSDDKSRSVMREEFTKAAWAQKRYIHPYSMYPDPRYKEPSKSSKIGMAVKISVVKSLQKYGHIAANFNFKQAMMATVMGGAIAGAMVLAGVFAGVTAAAGLYTLSTLMSSRFLFMQFAPKVLRAASKGGMRVLSPIVPLVPNKRRDVSALVSKFEPQLRSNNDVGGWTMEYNYLKHAIVVPYEFMADTFPDVNDYTPKTRSERPKQKLLNSLALQDGVNFNFVEERGRLYVEALGANGIRTIFDTNGLLSVSERLHDPCQYCSVDGSLTDLFDGLHKGQKVVFRHVANKPAHLKSIAARNENEDENDCMIVSDMAEIPADFVTRYAKSKEQFEAELGCKLEDFDTEDFVDIDFMTAKARKKTLKTREKEKAAQTREQRRRDLQSWRQQRLQLAFEEKTIAGRIRARQSNDNYPYGGFYDSRGQSARSSLGAVDITRLYL